MQIMEMSDREVVAFLLMKKVGIFNLSNGSAEIHFNPQGEVASIELHAKVFRR